PLSPQEPVRTDDMPEPVAKKVKAVPALTPLKMKQAVLQWLAKQDPGGIATKVATRISKYQVDVAAFWSLPAGNRRRIEKTVLVEIRNDRDHCWPDCGNRETILKKLRELKAEQASLEKIIEKTEPRLKASDTLFEEYECWDYGKSQNADYHKCLNNIEELQHNLYKGSRLELIRQSHTADFIYIAFPEGTIHADELIDGIGLLAIKDNLEIEEIKTPDALICKAENRNHIVQNIAIACRKNSLFANGVNIAKDKIFITNPPRRRRK
ncbi:MAG: hypothetical protein KAS17_12635, partial [Victivallaceae bacterium]|nr:hypothetical protein [Victivallaceae bacterium]